MIDKILLGLVEPLIGKGDPRSKGNYAFKCVNPLCSSHMKGKKKLEINFTSNETKKNQWSCWVCETRGTTIKSLLRYIKVSAKVYDELNMILGTSYVPTTDVLPPQLNVDLPKEFTPFIEMEKNNIVGRHALNYLIKGRGISFQDIIKHNIGYCEGGQYNKKIIIPSYSKDGILDYFVARSFEKDPFRPLDAPISDKNIIGFESLINWDLPIVITEGPFDAISIKRNAIPLFGKIISPKLKKKLMLNKIKTIYLSLDEDALKKTLFVAEELISMGKELFVVRLEGKDPSEIGFEEYTKLIQKVTPFSYTDLIKLKMEINLC